MFHIGLDMELVKAKRCRTKSDFSSGIFMSTREDVMPRFNSQVYQGSIGIAAGGVHLFRPEKPMSFRYCYDSPSMGNAVLFITIQSNSKKFSTLRNGQEFTLYMTVEEGDYLAKIEHAVLNGFDKQFHLIRKNSFSFTFDLKRSHGARVTLDNLVASIRIPIYSTDSAVPIYSTDSRAPIYSTN